MPLKFLFPFRIILRSSLAFYPFDLFFYQHIHLFKIFKIECFLILFRRFVERSSHRRKILIHFFHALRKLLFSQAWVSLV